VPEITDDPPTLAVVVREYILAICERCNWNINLAARVLDVSVKTIYNHLNRYEQAGLVEHLPKAWKRRKAG
jgi:transposase